MEDAYVIGIRLALDNGVSAGIAAIAADLGRLDAAIAATAVHLQQLGAESPRVVLARAAQPATPAAAVAPEVPLPQPTSAPAPLTRGGTETSAPVVRILAQSAAPPVHVQNDVRMEATAPAVAAPRTPDVTVIVPAAQTSPTAPGPVAGERTPPAAVSAPVAADRSARLAVSAMPGSAPKIETVFAPASTVAAPAAPSAAAPSVAPAAAAYPVTSAAPPPRETGGGNLSGDVYLDGTRMGRWVAEQLAREAGRPQAGVTGFDPRLSPAWPGTLQGD